MKELVIDDEPDDPAIITVHAKRIPNTSQEDNLRSIYDPHSPPAYITNLDGLVIIYLV